MSDYEALLSRLLGVRRASLRAGLVKAHRACCPICQPEGPRPGRDPALSVAQSDTGRLLAHCHKCETPGHEILRHVGIQQVAGTHTRAVLLEHDPGCWISAVAAADALEAVVVQAINGNYHDDQELVLDSVFKVHQRLEMFKAAARDAMRSERRAARDV